METFHWNPCFVTGLHDVDEQHHGLVDVINRFGQLLNQENGASPDDIERVFAELTDYARFHFTEEEAMMASLQLDSQYIAQHKQRHARFLEEVHELHPTARGGNRDTAASLLKFLTHWLAYHILGADQFMARQIALIQSGVSPHDAYATPEPNKDPATDTLLSALNGLFQEVSDRNHELQQLNRTLEARVAERTSELTLANERLQEIANTDVLTGLPNRRYAMRCFSDAWHKSVCDATPISCMMLDADGFKQINDSYGHDAGDVVLRELSRQLVRSVRNDDIVCRLGGDEFLIICAGTGWQDAMKLAEKVRKGVSELRVPAGAGQWVGSVSIGVATRAPDMPGTEELMKVADEGVYAAKRNGRNCVASHQVPG